MPEGEKIGGDGSSNSQYVGGDNMPSPGWNRINGGRGQWLLWPP